jgi:carbon monoxide dehydrogenase subunit G
MHYDGSFEVSSSKDVVYAFVIDPAKIATILPDVQNVRIIDTDNFSLKAKLGISFVKGLMDVKCTITEKTPSTSLKLNVRANGLSSVADLGSSFTLEDAQSGGTLVKWTVDAKIAGLLARVGSRLIDSATEKYVAQMTDALKQKLSMKP